MLRFLPVKGKYHLSEIETYHLYSSGWIRTNLEVGVLECKTLKTNSALKG